MIFMSQPSWLFTVCPVTGASPVMCHGKNQNFVCCGSIDDAVGEATKNVSPPGAAEYGAEKRVDQDNIGCALELGNKRAAQFDASFQ
jgi:hypothetical protein